MNDRMADGVVRYKQTDRDHGAKIGVKLTMKSVNNKIRNKTSDRNVFLA